MVWLRKWLSWLWPQKMQTRQGALSPVLEIAWENGRKVLNAQEVNYSFGSLHRIFQIAFQKTGIAEKKPEQVLILGYGAGSIANILVNELHLHPEITGVEADPEVIRIARTEFGADTIPGLHLVQAKAEDFVANTDQHFDLIAVDVFVESKVPESCQSLSFLEQLDRMLVPGGTIIFNRMPQIPVSGIDEFRLRFKSVFPKKEAIRLNLGQSENMILAAVK